MSYSTRQELIPLTDSDLLDFANSCDKWKFSLMVVLDHIITHNMRIHPGS